MNEHDFILKLQKRANEQEQIMKGMPFPSFFASTSIWLGNHPWKILIPTAFLVSLVLQVLFGKNFDDIILKIFGGFGIIRLNFPNNS